MRYPLYSLLAVVLTASPLVAQPCDEVRVGMSDPADPLSYKERSPVRCEGLFIQPVSSETPLFLAGFVEYSVFDPSNGIVPISWPETDASEVRVRVQSIDPQFHFQMDAAVSPEGPLEWAATLPARYGKDSRQLGVLAWFEPEDGERVHVPVVAGSPDRPRVCEYSTLIRNVNYLRDVRLTVLRGDGSIEFEGPVGANYRGGSGIRVRLGIDPDRPDAGPTYMRAPGEYTVRVSGQPARGSRQSVTFRVHQPGFAPTCS